MPLPDFTHLNVTILHVKVNRATAAFTTAAFALCAED
jgi:hypothetical protein